MARDLGGPGIAGQLVSCPMLDDRNDTVSSRQYDGFGSWSRQNNETAWGAVRSAVSGGAELSPYASVSRADSLENLPPAYIDAGAAEVFRDEAVAYASRIWAVGGNAELHVWAGGHHAFHAGNKSTRVGRASNEAQDSWLRRVWAPIG